VGQFPVERIDGRTVVARVKMQTDRESLAPLGHGATPGCAGLRQLEHVVGAFARAVRPAQSIAGSGSDAGKKSCRCSKGEIVFLDGERGELEQLTREKNLVRFQIALTVFPTSATVPTGQKSASIAPLCRSAGRRLRIDDPSASVGGPKPDPLCRRETAFEPDTSRQHTPARHYTWARPIPNPAFKTTHRFLSLRSRVATDDRASPSICANLPKLIFNWFCTSRCSCS